MKRLNRWFSIPYYLWIAFFVVIPLVLVLWQSLHVNGEWSLANFRLFFTSPIYLKMIANSVFYAFVITALSVLISYPAALVLSKMRHKQLWLMLIILPTWINLLLKAYAFMGIFSIHGAINQLLTALGFAPQQLLFTNASFIFVATYVQIPFMILPIFNAIEAINPAYISASYDLGATRSQTFWRVIFPLSMPGLKSGIQSVFIPSLSLFMLTRLIGGNRVVTLGTAIEQHFLVTQNWSMGSAIGVVLIIAMIVIMLLTNHKKESEK